MAFNTIRDVWCREDEQPSLGQGRGRGRGPSESPPVLASSCLPLPGMRLRRPPACLSLVCVRSVHRSPPQRGPPWPLCDAAHSPPHTTHLCTPTPYTDSRISVQMPVSPLECQPQEGRNLSPAWLPHAAAP